MGPVGSAACSCERCAALRTEGTGGVPGVTAVTVDVENGRVSVTGDRDLGAADVPAAVEAAGRELTDPTGLFDADR